MTITAAADAAPTAAPRRIAIRPLALPSEHGGWGFLLEPIVFALIVAPSWAGGLTAVAAIGAFLARHPLKLAAQDLLRRRTYPRTSICFRLGWAYGSIAALALTVACAIGGARLLIPMAIAAPLAFVQFAADARNHGRALMPEFAGAVAMGGVAAAIVLGGGGSIVFAAILWSLLILRTVPALVRVRAVLHRTRARVVAAIALHVIALALVVKMPVAVIAVMALLLGRAVIMLTMKRPPAAKTVGISELVVGGVSIVAMALALA